MAEYSIEAELKANVRKFKKAIETARNVTQKFKRESDSVKDTELDANIKPLKRNIKIARKLMQKFTKSKNEVNVDADTSEATRKMGVLMAVKQALSRRVIIPIEARINNFQSVIKRMANFMQSFGVVTQSMIGGIGLSFSSALVPIIASLVPAIMAVGNAIGVLGSGAVALAASFGIAGGAALAFGAAALPTITSIIDGTAEGTKENIKAAKQLKSLKSAWQGVTDAIAPQVAEAFTNAMTGLEKVVKSLSPMFDSLADAVVGISEKFNEFMDSSTAQGFFKYLKKNAAPILTDIVDGIGGFIKGLMNLTVAFAPLTSFMSKGFADMGDSFAGFTKRVAKSKELESFIDYVKRNLPTIKKIFGDVFTGIVNLFVAFSDNSELIFNALGTMAEKFKTWSATIAESDAFQKFIQYVQENGPKVIELIGNVVNFIIQLGIALAPLGAKMLEIANAVISWTTALMQNNPLIGKLIGLVTVVGGALMALVPFITMVVTAFSGFGTAIMKVIPWILNIGKFIFGLSNPIGIIITIIVTLATIIITNWDTIWAKTKEIFSAIGSFLSEKWQSIKTYTVEKITEIVTNVKTKFQEIKTTIQNKITEAKNALVEKFQEMVSNARQKATEIVTNVRTKFQEIKTTIQNKITEAKTALVNKFTEMVSNTRTKATEIWSTVKEKFSDVVDSVKEKMENVKTTVEDLWGNVMDFLEGIDLFEIGQNIIQGLINGIKDMAGGLVDAAKGVVGDAIEGAKNLLGINSPSKVFFQFGKWTDEGLINGIKSMAHKVAKTSQNLASTVTDSFNPNLDIQSSQITSSLRGLKRSTTAQVQSGVNANVSVSKQPIQIIIRNEADAEWLRTYVNEGNAIDSTMNLMD